jgi:hypothetical protein
MTDTTQLSPGSERVRRFRKRKAKDMLLVEIELYPTERDKLIRLGYLHKAHRSNKTAVRDAIEQFLERHLDPPSPWPLGEWHSNGVDNG